MLDRQRSKVEEAEIAFFASYYEGQAYNLTGWQLRLKRELRSLLRASGQSRLKRVLSIGCGDGQFELLAAPHSERVTGLDISPEAIDVARRMAAQAGITNVDFLRQSMNELQWDDTYDAIVCLGFLHHVPPAELPQLLRQVHEHLAPNGLFYSQDPNINGILRKLGRVVMGRKYDKYHSPDERELDPPEIAALGKAAGFSSVRIGYIDLTLIPALFVLAKGPSWPMYLCAAADWIWCRLPFLRRYSSGFTAAARK